MTTTTVENLTKADGNAVVVFSDYDPYMVLRRETCYYLEETIVVIDFFSSGNRQEESRFTSFGELKSVSRFDDSGRATFSSEYEDGSIVRSFDRKYDCNGDQFEQITYNDLGEPYLWYKSRIIEGRSKIFEIRDLLNPTRRAEMRLRAIRRIEQKLGRKLPRPDRTQLCRGFTEN